MGDYAAGFFFDEEFRRSANDRKVITVKVKEVGRGVDRAKVAVYVKGVESCRSSYTVGWNSLNDVATGYVFS
jgi:hypothetical protein